ncbi:HEPN domain-containing protein [bacterium]|nr:HEPN domain-containing protein [bacterium]
MGVPDEWVERAEYDIKTARAMLGAGRYLYVVFCCQQAVEKALKAIIALKTGAMPPRLHNLPALAERAGLDVGDDQAELLELLTRHYIESRYPEDRKRIASLVDKRLAESVLRRSEEMAEWLPSLLK